MLVTIAQRIFKLIRDKYGVEDARPVYETDRLRQELGMNSIDTIEFLMQLEDSFRIEFPDKTEQKWVTVADVIKSVEDRLNESSEKIT